MVQDLLWLLAEDRRSLHRLLPCFSGCVLSSLSVKMLIALVAGLVGPGTVGFLLVVGTLVPAMMWLNGRCPGLPNRGLAPNPRTAPVGG